MQAFFGMGWDGIKRNYSPRVKLVITVGHASGGEKKKKRLGNYDADRLDLLSSVLVLYDAVAELPATVTNIH